MSGRERTPSSLQECLDAPAPRRGLWRSWFILLIVAPCLYYIVFLRTTSRVYPVPQKHFNPPSYKELSAMDQPHSEADKTKGTLPTKQYSSTKEDKFIKYLSRGFQFLPLEHAKESDKPSPPIEKADDHYKKVTMLPAAINTAQRFDKNALDSLPFCDYNPDDFENLTIKIRNITEAMTYREKIQNGGYYQSTECRSRHKIAVLVPFRDRQVNLAMFLYNLHPFLIEQKLEYRIFVIQQSGKEPFNRGRLFNAGFLEANKFQKWDCVIFHDVDLLPTNTKILYTCPTWPRHMSAAVEGREQDPKFHALFGGVTAMSLEHYKIVNGYSNMYWGWGGEDSDMFWRIRAAGLPITRYNKEIATYLSLQHEKPTENTYKDALIKTAMERYKQDGLKNLEYKLLEINTYHLYTVFLIDINTYKKNFTQLQNEVQEENERYLDQLHSRPLLNDHPMRRRRPENYEDIRKFSKNANKMNEEKDYLFKDK